MDIDNVIDTYVETVQHLRGEVAYYKNQMMLYAERLEVAEELILDEGLDDKYERWLKEMEE